MRKMSRRGVLAGLGLAATGLGCGGMNPFLIPYFFNHDTKVPAEYPLTPHPKKPDVKVVVLVSAKMGLPADLAGVDRMLNAELITVLDSFVKANEDRVQVLKMPRIDEYRTQNPNWRSVHPCDMAKKLAEGTDYVIDIEVLEMDLYKPRSQGQWLQGRATVSISAYDVTKAVQDPAYKQELSFEYPRGREVEKESAAQLSAFRMSFVQYIAKEVAAKFVATSPQRGRMSDGL
jgi:hypothetical protein